MDVKKDTIRISISLDSKTKELLDALAKKEENKTVSEIVRSAITTYFELNNGKNELNAEKLRIYRELVNDEENILVDIELWAAIMDELSKRDYSELLERIKKIGFNQGVQNKIMGLKDIYESLKYFEAKNWFNVKANGNSYVVILPTRSEQKLVKVFLENMFKAQSMPVEILDGLRKLTIVKKDDKKTDT
ncbi:ribbon-helix-helix protein, CopG family [Archaeoglobus veneficus]|uniref:CopG-like domain-containing protein DNA-binding protein n=1 Tax=Archaeoglobus veneficus (strain DSM 11195 / SNP6) TaxID=693661 RepID=F2KPJ1_ARCVS|nr:ribbon-helix-helix protein, CopG family [Archaeoglobus veneficus]AEA46422.1 CopG-like domain-containing protein DNA-binding protein [Archaeoglobus veneficus SNP6]